MYDVWCMMMCGIMRACNKKMFGRTFFFVGDTDERESTVIVVSESGHLWRMCFSPKPSLIPLHFIFHPIQLVIFSSTSRPVGYGSQPVCTIKYSTWYMIVHDSTYIHTWYNKISSHSFPCKSASLPAPAPARKASYLWYSPLTFTRYPPLLIVLDCTVLDCTVLDPFTHSSV